MSNQIRGKIERYGYATEKVSIELIRGNRYRSEGLEYKSEIERTNDLIKSIKKDGLWLSVMGTWLKNESGEKTVFELIYGHKRVQAARVLSFKEIDVIVVKGELTELERINIMADENYASKYASSINLITITDVEKAVKGLIKNHKSRDSFVKSYPDFEAVFHNSTLFNNFRSNTMSALIEVILLVLNYGCEDNEELWHIDIVNEALLFNRDRNLKPTLKLLSNPHQASECLNAVRNNRDVIVEEKTNEVIREAIKKIEINKEELSGRKLKERIYEIADEIRYPERNRRIKRSIEDLNKNMRGIYHSSDSLLRRIVEAEVHDHRQEATKDVERQYTSALNNLVKQLVKYGIVEVDRLMGYKKVK